MIAIGAPSTCTTAGARIDAGAPHRSQSAHTAARARARRGHAVASPTVVGRSHEPGRRLRRGRCRDAGESATHQAECGPRTGGRLRQSPAVPPATGSTRRTLCPLGGLSGQPRRATPRSRGASSETARRAGAPDDGWGHCGRVDELVPTLLVLQRFVDNSAMSRHGNLVLTLRPGDVVTIGESTVTYVGLDDGRVRVAIRARPAR